MRRFVGVVVAVLALALWAGPVARGQSTVWGKVQGKVTLDGKPLEGAEVTFNELSMGRSWTLKTDKHGEYFGAGLMVSDYNIEVKYQGRVIGQLKKRKVYFGDDDRNRFDFVLSAQGQAEESKKRQEETQRASNDYEQAVALNKAGKYQEALAVLEPLLQRDPKQWVVHYQLAMAYQGMRRNEEAEAAYKKAIELHPQEGELHSLLGQLYIKMKREEEARKEFQIAAQLNPENAAVYYHNLGITLYNTGDLKGAIEPFRQATEFDPSRADSYYFLGVCLLGTAQYKTENNEVKIISAPGTREAFEHYLALAPSGQYANDAKAAIETLGGTVSTTVRVKKKN